MKRLPLTPAQVTEIWTSRASSRAEFQILFGVSARRLAAWEAGGIMSAAEQTLMLVIQHEPDAVRRAVKRLVWQQPEVRE